MASNCHWCGGDCGATCLGLRQSTQMPTSDPAYFMLTSGRTSTPRVHREGCYICEDPEFAQMGMSLCTPCVACQAVGRGDGHVPADDEECSECGTNARELWEAEQEATA